MGTALLNFGTRANSFGHGPPDLQQNMFVFFQCWFLERHPWSKSGTLKFVSPCAHMTAVHIWFQARIRQAFAGGSKRKWQIQVECVTCLKRVICLSPFFEILLLSNANWIVSSDHRSINMSVASLLQRQILPRFLDAMSSFPRKVQDFGALKAYFRPQSLRLRGQSWGQRLWERKFLQFRHADLVSGGPRLSPEVACTQQKSSGPCPILLARVRKFRGAAPKMNVV